MHEFNDDDILGMLRASLKHRNEALNILYDNLYPGIARFILKNSGNVLDAKDLFQESLIVFYEKAITPDFVLTGSIKNYLHAVCRNLWFKRLRNAGKEVSYENLDIQGAFIYESLDEESDDRRQIFAKLMNEIGEGCRDILMRFYFERQSMKDIAADLNLANEGVAKNKKARCIQKLKDLARKMKP